MLAVGGGTASEPMVIASAGGRAERDAIRSAPGDRTGRVRTAARATARCLPGRRTRTGLGGCGRAAHRIRPSVSDAGDHTAPCAPEPHCRFPASGKAAGNRAGAQGLSGGASRRTSTAPCSKTRSKSSSHRLSLSRGTRPPADVAPGARPGPSAAVRRPGVPGRQARPPDPLTPSCGVHRPRPRPAGLGPPSTWRSGASVCTSADIRLSGTACASGPPSSAAATVPSHARRTPVDRTSIRWAIAPSGTGPPSPPGPPTGTDREPAPPEFWSGSYDGRSLAPRGRVQRNSPWPTAGGGGNSRIAKVWTP